MNIRAHSARLGALVVLVLAGPLLLSAQANEDRPPQDPELSALAEKAPPAAGIPQAIVAELNHLSETADGALLDGEFERARDALVVLNSLEVAHARQLGDVHRRDQKLRLDSLERMCGLDRAGQQRVRAAAICCAAGKACAEAGDLQRAERQMADGVELLEQTVGRQDWFCVRSRMLLGRIALDAGHPREAKVAFQQTLEAGPQLLSDDSERAVILDLLALAQGQLGEFTEGEQHMQASVALRERVLPLKHPDRVVMLTDYAWFCAMKEDWERSEAYAEQAIEKCRELRMPPEHPCLVCAHERQARALMAQSEFDKAEPLLRGVVAARQSASPGAVCELLEMHAECLQQLNRTGEADRLRAKITKLRQAQAHPPAGRG